MTILPPPPTTIPAPPLREDDDDAAVDFWADIVRQVDETWRPAAEPLEEP